MKQAGTDVASLQKRLQPGYHVSGEIFSGGVVESFDNPGEFPGWLEAYGEELVAYLAERGFKLSRA